MSATTSVYRLRERCGALERALRWALDYIADGTDETPPHSCEFTTNPPKGACDFHEKYWAAREVLDHARQPSAKVLGDHATHSDYCNGRCDASGEGWCDARREQLARLAIGVIQRRVGRVPGDTQKP